MMEEIHLDSIQAFNTYQGMETLHPLVSVVHVENTDHIKECLMHYGLYAIYLKENKGCKISYTIGFERRRSSIGRTQGW